MQIYWSDFHVHDAPRWTSSVTSSFLNVAVGMMSTPEIICIQRSPRIVAMSRILYLNYRIEMGDLSTRTRVFTITLLSMVRAATVVLNQSTILILEEWYPPTRTRVFTITILSMVRAATVVLNGLFVLRHGFMYSRSPLGRHLSGRRLPWLHISSYQCIKRKYGIVGTGIRRRNCSSSKICLPRL